MNLEWRRWLVGLQWFREPEYSRDSIHIRYAFYFYLGPLRVGGKWRKLWWSRGNDAIRPY